MAGGKGKGRGGFRDLMCGDSMVWVWLVILVMVLSVFILVAVTGSGRVDMKDEMELGGGPWWAWMIGVTILLFVFVIVYMISMQYAEPALSYKMVGDDQEAGLPLKRPTSCEAKA